MWAAAHPIIFTLFFWDKGDQVKRDPTKEPSDAVLRDIKGLKPNRRPGDRQIRQPLREIQRERLIRYQDRAAACGTSWMVLSRRTKSGLEARTVAPLRCGWRGCPTCGTSARRYLLDRIGAAPWRRMLTITIPPSCVTKHVAWASTGEYIDWITRWIRKDARKHWQDWIPEGMPVEEFARRRWRPDYAWVLEMQPGTEYPHWHILLTSTPVWDKQRFADLVTRLRSAWQAYLKAEQTPHIHIRNPRNNRAAAWYVSTYCGKDLPPAWILAILGRRRIWGTSLPREKKTLTGWAVDCIITDSDAMDQVTDPEAWGESHGWHYGYLVELSCTCWFRPYHPPVLDPALLVSIGPICTGIGSFGAAP